MKWKLILAMVLCGASLGSCEFGDRSPYVVSDSNSGEIFVSAANKSPAGAADRYELLVSTPSDKDQLIICESDQPDKCNANTTQYQRVVKGKLNKPRSFFLIKNFQLALGKKIAIKAWQTNGKTAVGRVIDVTDTTKATPTGAATNPATYARDVASILNTRCVGCHSATPSNPRAGAARRTPMDSAAVMGINPGQQRRAYVTNILSRVTTTNSQQKMPRGGSLSAGQIDTIRRWSTGGYKP